MKYYIITGETSGDLHAANLVKGILKHDPKAEIRAWGGQALKNIQVTVVKDLNELNFMGLVEVLKHLKTIKKNFKFAHNDIKLYNPDVLILVDFPGFNLRLARWAKSENIKVFYYISPTVWAWHKSRIKQIKKYVDKLFVILPFEKDFFKKHQIKADYEGHPILDALQPELHKEKNIELFRKKYNLPDKPFIAILPGSRQQEVKNFLPVMLEVTKDFPEFHFLISGLTSLKKELYSIAKNFNNVSIIFNQTYDILRHVDAAIVKSGTSTLETALFKVPQVVCYKTNNLTFQIAKRIVDVKYISLVNLILEKEVVKELIQYNFNAQNLKNELRKILDFNNRDFIIKEYDKLKIKLGNEGCSERIALKIISYLKSHTE